MRKGASQNATPGSDLISASDKLHESLRREGRIVDALDELERGLFLRRTYLGDTHPEVEMCSKAFTAYANSTAMASLQVVIAFQPNMHLHETRQRMLTGTMHLHDGDLKLLSLCTGWRLRPCI